MCILTQGRYVVEVKFFGYSNPTGQCAECPIPNGQTTHSCCDSFVTTNCTGSLRCDSFFYFCLRTLGDRGTNNSCSYFGSNTTFAVIDDAAPFNINDFGLENPLILPGLTNNFTVSPAYLSLSQASYSKYDV